MRDFAPRSAPSDAAALKQEGNGYFKKGQFEEAAICYTAAIDLWMDPADRATLYGNRAAARLKLSGASKWQLALSDAQSATKLAPTNAKAHFRVGQALRKLGRPAEATKSLGRMLELVPGDAAGVEELRLATAEAAEQARRRAAAAPPSPEKPASPPAAAAKATASAAASDTTTSATASVTTTSVGLEAKHGLPLLPTSPMWSLPPVSVSDRAADLGRVLQRVADRASSAADDGGGGKAGPAPGENGNSRLRKEGGGSGHGGFAPLVPSEWMKPRTATAAEATERNGRGTGGERWPTWWEAALEGGEVPEARARTAEGRGAAAEAMRRRRPLVLRGAAAALVPTVAEEVGSMKRLT